MVSFPVSSWELTLLFFSTWSLPAPLKVSLGRSLVVLSCVIVPPLCTWILDKKSRSTLTSDLHSCLVNVTSNQHLSTSLCHPVLLCLNLVFVIGSGRRFICFTQMWKSTHVVTHNVTVVGCHFQSSISFIYLFFCWT